MSSNRIGVFVDLVSQFSKVISFFPGEKIDYDAYLSIIEKAGSITKAIAYGASVGSEADIFINYLTGVGFEVKYVPAKISNGKPVIKYTDRSMAIVVDIIKMLDRIDMVVIGTSNSNIIPFLTYLREKGIIVILFACNISNEMRRHCDEYWEITEKCLENKRYVKTEVVK